MTRLERLPYRVSYFLGYRKPNHTIKTLPSWRIYFWSFLASWIGIALLELIFTYSESFKAHNTPMIVASFVNIYIYIYSSLFIYLMNNTNFFFMVTVYRVLQLFWFTV